MKKTPQKKIRSAAAKGRKSPAQQTAEKLQANPDRWQPSEFMSDRAKEIWIRTVNTLPADHFFESDLQLLQEYCETAAIVERIRARWNGMETIIKNNGDEVINPTLTAISRNQATMAALAGKLRICPSSRLSASKAGHEKPRRNKSLREGLMR